MAEQIKSIGVLFSGGDAPGMNCVLRAVVRTALAKGIKPYGVQRGWKGLLEGEIHELKSSDVGNIMQLGGTLLQTSRCPEFHEPEIRKEAANILRRKGIDALIVCGGNGSFNAASLLHSEQGIPVIGIPATIDNDISGTDYTIGFDTAVTTAMEAVDKIRDTAHSHERTFIVEVMGRHSPAIALNVGVCCGAEYIVLPNHEQDIDAIYEHITRGRKHGKQSSVIIVAEGNVPGVCYEIKKALQEKFDVASHVCTLGHIQRGGAPSAVDRFRSSTMGYQAVQWLIEGEDNLATTFIDGQITKTPLDQCLENKHDYEKPYLEMVEDLSL